MWALRCISKILLDSRCDIGLFDETNRLQTLAQRDFLNTIFVVAAGVFAGYLITKAKLKDKFPAIIGSIFFAICSIPIFSIKGKFILFFSIVSTCAFVDRFFFGMVLQGKSKLYEKMEQLKLKDEEQKIKIEKQKTEKRKLIIQINSVKTENNETQEKSEQNRIYLTNQIEELESLLKQEKENHLEAKSTFENKIEILELRNKTQEKEIEKIKKIKEKLNKKLSHSTAKLKKLNNVLLLEKEKYLKAEKCIERAARKRRLKQGIGIDKRNDKIQKLKNSLKQTEEEYEGSCFEFEKEIKRLKFLDEQNRREIIKKTNYISQMSFEAARDKKTQKELKQRITNQNYEIHNLKSSLKQTGENLFEEKNKFGEEIERLKFKNEIRKINIAQKTEKIEEIKEELEQQNKIIEEYKRQLKMIKKENWKINNYESEDEEEESDNNDLTLIKHIDDERKGGFRISTEGDSPSGEGDGVCEKPDLGQAMAKYFNSIANVSMENSSPEKLALRMAKYFLSLAKKRELIEPAKFLEKYEKKLMEETDDERELRCKEEKDERKLGEAERFFVNAYRYILDLEGNFYANLSICQNQQDKMSFVAKRCMAVVASYYDPERFEKEVMPLINILKHKSLIQYVLKSDIMSVKKNSNETIKKRFVQYHQRFIKLLTQKEISLSKEYFKLKESVLKTSKN